MNISQERKNLMSIPSVIKLFLKKLSVCLRFSLPTFQEKSREHLIYSLLIRFRNFFLSKLWRFKDHPVCRFFVVSATKLSFPFFSFG